MALIVCCDLASYNVDVFSLILPVIYARSPVDFIERENEVESISLADFPAVENILDIESFGVGLGDTFVGLRDALFECYSVFDFDGGNIVGFCYILEVLRNIDIYGTLTRVSVAMKFEPAMPRSRACAPETY